MTTPEALRTVDPYRRSDTLRTLNRLAQQLAVVPISRWRSIDQRARNRWGGMWESVGVLNDQVTAYAGLVDDEAHAIAILAMQPDGRVRQAAIRYAQSHRLATLIPIAVMRASDWVPQVRAEAELVLDEIRSTGHFERFLPSLALMRSDPRSEPGSPRARQEYVAALRAEVIERVGSAALIDDLRSNDTRGRQEAARALVEIGRADDAFGAAVSQNDPVVANIIAGGVSEGFWTQRSNIDAALASKFAPVRVTGLFYLQRLDPQAAVTEATDSLTSSRASVRHAAQRLLAADGTDVAATYRTLLASGSRWAVVGIGETGNATDVDLLIDVLDSDDELVRASALRAAGRLDGRRVEPQLVAAVGDASLVVALAAARALARLRPTRASVDELWDIALAGRYVHTRRAAFKVFEALGRWEQLVVALRAISTHNPELFPAGDRLLRSSLQSWNRSFTAPPTGVLDELVDLVPPTFGWVDLKMNDLLLVSLGTYLPDQVTAWATDLEPLRLALRDAQSGNDDREAAGVTALIHRFGEPVVDDAIVALAIRRRHGVEPDRTLRTMLDTVLGVDSPAARRVFARVWHDFESTPTWPIGSTLTEALSAAPRGNRDPARWAELADDHDPSVVAGAISILDQLSSS